MKIYLAGPMTGLPHFNFPAFHAAAERLRAGGHEVFDPAARDIERHGRDISADNPAGCQALAEKNHGFDIRAAMADNMEWICREAEAIALLPGWQNSRGALAEKSLAEALKIKVIFLD